jgi:hypothetical protein
VQCRAVLGEQRLVGRHHALAGQQRLGQPGAGRLDAADHLDHQVHVLALGQAERVGGEQLFRHSQGAALAAGPAHRDAGQLESRADSRGQVVSLLVQQPDHLGTDRATAEQRDSHRPHPTSNASRSSSVSRRTITREAPSRTATTGGRGTWL